MKTLKFSQYNTLLDLNDRLSVLYNSKVDKYLIIKKEKEHLLDYQPQEILEMDKNIFNNLKEINAIVDYDKDELSEVIQKSKDIDNADDYFKLIINPTMSCNFSCWYCYESHVVGSKISQTNLERIYKLIDRILLNNPNLQEFDLSFFGGEPLMYYSKVTQPIINYYRTKYKDYQKVNFGISFTSNGYLLSDKILNHLLQGDEPKHFQITLDGHREEHNKVRVAQKKEGSYDKILESIATLTENDIEVVLRVNYTADNLYSVPQIADDISSFSDKSKQNLKVSLHRVWQDSGNNTNVEQGLQNTTQKFRNNDFFVGDQDLLDGLKNPCYADKKNELVINYNGDVYKCTARDFNKENKYGELSDDGDIAWNQDKITEWEHIKIQSKACQGCRILPICGGGCHQINLEAKGLDICQMGFDNAKKDEIILNRLTEVLLHEA